MIPVIVVLLFFASSIILGFLIQKTKRVVLPLVPPLPPGPSPWPIIGCVPEMWRNRPAYRWIHDLLKQLNTDIACVRLGKVHVIAVKSPEIAREFLKKHDAVFASRPITMATHLFSSGYLTVGVTPMGEQWKKMRRVLIAEVFNQSRLRWLLDKRNDEADNLVKFLYSQCLNSENGSVVNVRIAAQHYSANVMRRMFFNTRYFGKGREDGGPGLEEELHVSALFTLVLHTYAFCVSDYLPWLRPFDIGGHEKKVKDALKIIKQYQDPIIDERVRMWRCSNQENRIKAPVEESLLDVFISLKGADGQPLLSAEEIKAQITELQLATVDNPFSISEWALSEMLNQPEMLTKAQEELNRIVGIDKHVQESHIPHLPYIRACARESLRLHPVAPFNLPHVSTDDAIVAGYFIPKGSSVILSRLGLGRNPKVWENPLRFDPERHLSGDASQQVELEEHELRFISFTTGRRGCMGGTLGTTITVMLFARLLQGFTWSMPPKVDKIDLTEAPTLFKLHPLHAHAKPRLPAAMYPV
ncbi:putative phenylalanine N-monooxygenase [Rosa chinensis]|uniref:Putative phenylalanine N-monooxygenase n=1 Tax=Rosa chinensis TaxID=74649 RepID=A0A2P6SAI0_ROSCH|nr:tryptophan N-monooxygenase CYP79A68 [Rosa chinensis]PRQ55672.1 putative phenylalanine N-monooxygenase [Rosa chinensis]